MTMYKTYSLDVVDGDRGSDWRLPVATVERNSYGVDLESYSRRGTTPIVRDQGAMGSCVGFSGCTVLAEHAEHRDKVFSPMWLYTEAQKLDEWPGEDYSGTSISGACKALRTVGVCQEDFWPYGGDIFRGAEIDASRHRIHSYFRIEPGDIVAMKTMLMKECLWCAFDVREGFYNAVYDGIVHDAGYLKGRSYGGHAVALVGWKTIDGRLYWEFQNSWGYKWGDHGFFYMSADLFSQVAIGGVYYVETNVESGQEIVVEYREKWWKKLWRKIRGFFSKIF